MATGLRNELTEMLRQKMAEMEQEMKDDKERLKSVDEKVNSFASGLLLEITKLKEETFKLKEEISQIKVSEEERKNKTRQLESKGQLLMKELLEKKNQNNGIIAAQIEPKLTSFDLIDENDNYKPIIKLGQGWGTKGCSEWFKWPGYPVLSRLEKMFENNGDACLTLRLAYQNEDKYRAKFKLIPNVYYVIRYHDLFRGPQSICINAFCLFKNTADLNYKHRLESGQGKPLHKGTIEIYVESYTMAQQVHSYDGTLNWTIEEFSKRKEMAEENLLVACESPYFYTGAKGYRVQVRMYLDGFGKYKRIGVTAQICFLTGKFDEELSGDFPHRTTVTLISGNGPEYNVMKTVEKNVVDKRSYEIDLCDSTEILYLIENDAFVVNVTVEAL